MEIGRICIKNTGRESGRYCVVLKKVNNSFVSVTGPKLLTGVKRRKCNVDHLNSTPYKIGIKEDASDEEVISAMDKEGIVTKLGLKKPSAAQMKAEAAKPKPEPKPKVEAKPKTETKEEAKKEQKGTKKESKKEVNKEKVQSKKSESK